MNPRKKITNEQVEAIKQAALEYYFAHSECAAVEFSYSHEEQQYPNYSAAFVQFQIQLAMNHLKSALGTLAGAHHCQHKTRKETEATLNYILKGFKENVDSLSKVELPQIQDILDLRDSAMAEKH